MWITSLSLSGFSSGFIMTFLVLSFFSYVNTSSQTRGSVLSEIPISSTRESIITSNMCIINNETETLTLSNERNESFTIPILSLNETSKPLLPSIRPTQLLPTPTSLAHETNYFSNTRFPSIVFVVSAWKMKPEDIAWLETLPYPIVAYSETLRPKQNDHHRTEAGKYTHFMCAHYETLPDLVIFIHGHESGWHRTPEVITNLITEIEAGKSNPNKLMETFAYKSFTSDKLWVAGTIDGLKPIMNYTWNIFLGKYFSQPFAAYPDFMTGGNCCSELIVSSNRIRSRPRELWCDYLKFLNDETPMGPANYFGMSDDKVKGMIFEWFVPFVFGSYK